MDCTVSEALLKRKSVRAYLDKEVPQSTIENIIELASNAPSGVNTQPWEVAIVTGESKQILQQKMEQAFRDKQSSCMQYQYYPKEWKTPFKERRKACGLQMYANLDIKREDKDKQIEQWAKNYRAFDAPVMLLFFMDKSLQTGSFLDYGMFLQGIMLAAIEAGLATCPQASLAEYPEIVKQTLGYSDDKVLICGMALGYADKRDPVNNYRTDRELIKNFCRFFK